MIFVPLIQRDSDAASEPPQCPAQIPELQVTAFDPAPGPDIAVTVEMLFCRGCGTPLGPKRPTPGKQRQRCEGCQRRRRCAKRREYSKRYYQCRKQAAQ